LQSPLVRPADDKVLEFAGSCAQHHIRLVEGGFQLRRKQIAPIEVNGTKGRHIKIKNGEVYAVASANTQVDDWFLPIHPYGIVVKQIISAAGTTLLSEDLILQEYSKFPIVFFWLFLPCS